MRVIKKAHAMLHHVLLGHTDSFGGAGVIAFSTIIFGMMAAFFAVAFGLFIFWIVMLIDALRRQWPHEDQRTLWLIILIASFFVQLYWLAAVVYFFAIKKPLDRGEAPTFFQNQRSAPPTPPADATEPVSPVDPIAHKSHKKSHKE